MENGVNPCILIVINCALHIFSVAMILTLCFLVHLQNYCLELWSFTFTRFVSIYLVKTTIKLYVPPYNKK